MVGFKGMGLSGEAKGKDSYLGILAFETAKTMSRLVSLYKSLSVEEISRLKNGVVKSKGVAFLNSRNEEFLLSLARSERLEDLDRAAAAVARVGKKCNDFGLNRFDVVYRDLKLGIVDLGKPEYGSRIADRKVRRMEKLVSTTSCLHSALEALTELEISERKLNQWENRQTEPQKEKFDLFYQKLENLRNEVRRYKEVSLWSKTFDKSVDLMARIVCVIHARIRHVFGQQKSLSRAAPVRDKCLPHSGPILTTSKPTIVRFYSTKSLLFDGDSGYRNDGAEVGRSNTVFDAAGPHTVGGSGLALRYADVILLVEQFLETTSSVRHGQRESLYGMLPENLKALVRAKLSKNVKGAEDDPSLAEGWRVAMAEMMGWLAPMARDTVTWHTERSFDRMKFDARPTVLLLQTLHFSDKEKTEAAIVEVLVGLSCIFRFENRKLGN